MWAVTTLFKDFYFLLRLSLYFYINATEEFPDVSKLIIIYNIYHCKK